MEELTQVRLESLLTLHHYVSDRVIDYAQVFPVCLCLLPHQLYLSVDFVLARNELLFYREPLLLLLSYECLVLLGCFSDADNFTIFVRVGEYAVNAKELKVLFAKGFKFLSRVERALEIFFDDRGRGRLLFPYSTRALLAIHRFLRGCLVL